MFRAISHQLFGTEEYHQQLRSFLYTILKEEKAVYQAYWTESTGTYDEHLQNLNAWGTQVELQAITDYLSVPLYVCSPNTTNQAYRWVRFMPRHKCQSFAVSDFPTASFPFTFEHIELAHSQKKDHYNSIVSVRTRGSTQSSTHSTSYALHPPVFTTRVVDSFDLV